ncbi:uncharacterized protein LOC122824458 isoform X3 [Gambusia affinis]|uniref:uncharacterized protein LOC122824458 isoform X3 n=1 Tax=Gambusia affinis TaxID=33528 RepID=UPI001CDC1576|nr:uncharacterized protein LOC122824458 isoform X3 [Gambusia affinis]XP_043961140.1 uncharacterized protein LOC122824458 isoform X3 [Gambusia affinis]XP_043961145.1 uncharacterized protein LOC122824458 isoform X3 [Gambusia affinis]XP_043961150.1 uncharacterized protein LOC122824458 isoform X3 [Gambusia affinis]XP_043961153.1 uncharacterized protein LOC122824458 isoform X3 [Gambusia affinis]
MIVVWTCLRLSEPVLVFQLRFASVHLGLIFLQGRASGSAPQIAGGRRGKRLTLFVCLGWIRQTACREKQAAAERFQVSTWSRSLFLLLKSVWWITSAFRQIVDNQLQRNFSSSPFSQRKRDPDVRLNVTYLFLKNYVAVRWDNGQAGQV